MSALAEVLALVILAGAAPAAGPAAPAGTVVLDEKSHWRLERTWVPVPDSNGLREYDIATNTWSTPKTEGSAGGGMESSRAFFTFDTVNDVAVLHIDDRHHVYDPKARKWTTLPATIPEKVPHWGASSGFYDPETNAHFYFNAGDSDTDPGTMWAYRYARGAGR